VVLEVSRLLILSIIEESSQERRGFLEEWNSNLLGPSILESQKSKREYLATMTTECKHRIIIV